MPQSQSRPPRSAIIAGAAGVILLAVALIPQLWFPEGPVEPTLRVVALFASLGLIASALGLFNRWVATTQPRRVPRRTNDVRIGAEDMPSDLPELPHSAMRDSASEGAPQERGRP